MDALPLQVPRARRRRLGWPTPGTPADRALGGLLVTGLVVAGWAGPRWAARQQAVVWSVLLLALVGWSRLFGPVLFYELVRTARRGRYVVLRCLYVLSLLLFLWLVYTQYQERISQNRSLIGLAFQYGYGRWVVNPVTGSRSFVADPAALRAVQLKELARFSETFFFTFMCLQFLAVTVLTPAYTAGAIAEEKDRKTLEFLLATHLHGREIVLSKLAACLANLGLLVLAGLPVLSLTQLLGGVDPDLLLAGFAATGLSMLSLAAVSILHSVYARKSRDAIVLSYLSVAAYLIVSGLALFPLGYLSRPTASALEGIVAGALRAFNAGNLLIVLGDLKAAWNAGTPVLTVLPGLLRSYALFHGLVALAGVGWAVTRFRAEALRENSTGVVAGDGGWRSHFRPALDRSRLPPLVWKELFAEPGLSFNWFGKAVLVLIILVSFLPPLWILGEYVLNPPTPARGWDLDRSINLWVRAAGTLVACLTLVGVAVRAANGISGERDRQTLDGLLTTPLAPRDILFAKWLGSVLSVRWAWVWLSLIWGLGVVLGGLSPVTLPWLFLIWVVYAAFCASLGLRCSLVQPTTLRATLTTLTVLGALFLGHWLPWFFWDVPQPWRQSAWTVAATFQRYGLTPPLAFGWFTFQGDAVGLQHTGLLNNWYDDAWEVFLSIAFGLVCWAVAAFIIWRRLHRRFRTHLVGSGSSP